MVYLNDTICDFCGKRGEKPRIKGTRMAKLPKDKKEREKVIKAAEEERAKQEKENKMYSIEEYWQSPLLGPDRIIIGHICHWCFERLRLPKQRMQLAIARRMQEEAQSDD